MPASPPRARRAGRTRWTAILLLILLVMTAADAYASQPDRTIRVGIFQMHPMVFVDADGEPSGLYVDLLDAVASEYGWSVEYVPGAWADGLQGVREGRLDLMTVIIPTPERDQYLDFCRESVTTLWGQVFAGRGSGVQNILDLDGRRVAVMQDDLNGLNFHENARRFGVACEYIAASSHHEVFGLVQQGKAAAGVAPNIFGYSHAADYGLVPTPIVFDPSAVTFAAPEGRNVDVLATIDRRLRSWKADENSAYYGWLNRWTGPAGGGRSLPRWVAPAGAAILLAALLLLVWNRSLDHRVRERTRQAAASERKMRAVFDQTFQFLGVLDTDGRLQDVNRTALDFNGISRDDVIGRHFWDCPWWNHDPELQQELRTAVRNAAAGQMQYGHATHLGASGEPHHIEYIIKPIRDDSGRVIMLIPEGHDVTEKQRLERDLQQSQKMEAMGTLAGGIAHDFNNILMAITGFNELALQDAADRPDLVASLREVAQATERARSLVQQILTFSRRHETVQSVFDPSDVVQEAVRLLRSGLPPAIAIREEIRAGCRIQADPTQIHQIVMNLGTNACHAMEDGGGEMRVAVGPVTVPAAQPVLHGVMPPGDYVRLEVSDAGGGLDPAALSKIFEPFYTSKSKGKGTGLGLAVVHGIVKSSRGHLDVQTAPGRGATFRIHFPAVRASGGGGPTHDDATGQAGDNELEINKLHA